jgi:uncharacterized integral membrane protein
MTSEVFFIIFLLLLLLLLFIILNTNECEHNVLCIVCLVD